MRSSDLNIMQIRGKVYLRWPNLRGSELTTTSRPYSHCPEVSPKNGTPCLRNTWKLKQLNTALHEAWFPFLTLTSPLLTSCWCFPKFLLSCPWILQFVIGFLLLLQRLVAVMCTNISISLSEPPSWIWRFSWRRCTAWPNPQQRNSWGYCSGREGRRSDFLSYSVSEPCNSSLSRNW